VVVVTGGGGWVVWGGGGGWVVWGGGGGAVVVGGGGGDFAGDRLVTPPATRPGGQVLPPEEKFPTSAK